MMRVDDQTRRPHPVVMAFAATIGLGLAHVIRHICQAVAEGRLPGWSGL